MVQLVIDVASSEDHTTLARNIRGYLAEFAKGDCFQGLTVAHNHPRINVILKMGAYNRGIHV
jgi:hypothetical protein